MRFENKVVLITGGTRGLGFATTQFFARVHLRLQHPLGDLWSMEPGF